MPAARPHPLWRDYLEALLVAGLFLGFTNTFVLKTFYIPSGSMEDTLLVGDHLVVNRFLFARPGDATATPWLPIREPRRGDVVVFRSPEQPGMDLVKRCVGLPGDVVEIRDGQLWLDGRPAPDVAAVHKDPRHRRGLEEDAGPFTVPAGHYFFLGDNRDYSYDSRYWGPVPAHLVKGSAVVVYWSFGGAVPDGDWPGVGPRLAQLGRTVLGFFTHTRWDRSLRFVQ